MSDIEQLHRALDWWRSEAEHSAAELRKMGDENAALARENERLREALENLLEATEASPYEIVGRHPGGHPLSALGLAKHESRVLLEANHDRD